MRSSQSAFNQLECPECGRVFNPDSVQSCCPDCSGPLFAVYDLSAARLTLTREVVLQRGLEAQSALWRWSEILPVRSPASRLTLGETSTPVLRAHNLGETLGLSALYIKDESRGAVGCQDSRGMLVAVSRALELGFRDFVMAAAGSDGAALAACAARSRARAHVYMSRNAPAPEQIAVRTFGAELLLVDGLFSDIARQAAQSALMNGWLDVTAFREPYRCEGAKTIGLELAEAFGWDVPDVIIVAAGDGLTLPGLWKAFNELEQLGFIGAKRPRMAVVQAGISGLRVAEMFANRPILRAIQDSKGIEMVVSDEQIVACQKEMAVHEGIFAAPQGAASLAAVKQLIADGWVDRDERVVLVNSGSGLNYL